MSFLDIKDSAERATLVKEYVTTMKTVKQRNVANQELKLVIGDELQTLFHPIVNATKQAAEETRKELEPMKKTLTDIVGALTAQREHVAKPPLGKALDRTYGFYMKNGRLWMGNKAIQLDSERRILTVDAHAWSSIADNNRGGTYKGFKGEEVVYLPGDINGLAEKLQLLVAEFFAGNTTVRTELVHILDALLRLKQLTGKEYTNITARLAALL